MNFMGLQIITSPYIPERCSKLVVKEGIFSDAFHKQLQAWCDDFIGTEAVLLVTAGKVFTHPANVAALKLSLTPALQARYGVTP